LRPSQREKFGKRSEKLAPDQFNLALEDAELAQGVLEAAQERAEAALRGKGVEPPRIERVIEPASTQFPCGCGEMAKIGEDVSERLDVIPAQFRVLVARCLNGGHDRDIPAATSGTDRLPMHPGGRNGDGVMGDEFRVGSGTLCG